MIKLFNIYYFIAIIASILLILGLFFILKNKSNKTKKIVLFSILLFNLILHFLKFLFAPYNLNPDRYVRDVWFINICAVSVLTFPFIFISKSDGAKDFMFYLGVLSGGLALLYPTEAINNIYVMDVIRFYICHLTIIAIPLLMVLLKLHKLNFKRIWKMPFYMSAVLLFIICNQALQSELGFVSLRGNEITNIPYKNSSWIWGPTDNLAILLTWCTPNFMKYIPYGSSVGIFKYWPFFYMLPAVFIYFWIFPLLLCLPWEYKNIKKIFLKRKSKKILKNQTKIKPSLKFKKKKFIFIK